MCHRCDLPATKGRTKGGHLRAQLKVVASLTVRRVSHLRTVKIVKDGSVAAVKP